MSEHNPHHGHDPHGHEHGQVESSYVQPRPIVMFLVILSLATSFVFVIVKGLDWGFRKLDEPNQGQAATQVELPKEQSRKLPPEPLLQGAPGKGSTATTDVPTLLPLEEMAVVRKQTNDKVNGYGWVDKQAGIAHIPIDRAKAMIAEKGLPALPTATISDEIQKAEAVRKQVLNAGSSAGRMIRAPQPTPQPTMQTAPQTAQPQAQPPQQSQPQVHPQKH